jgi:hypothetical protein
MRAFVRAFAPWLDALPPVCPSFTSWELIIVDDSSTDDTWRLVLATLEQHPQARIRAIQKANGGLADARNVGLQYALPPNYLPSHTPPTPSHTSLPCMRDGGESMMPADMRALG